MSNNYKSIMQPLRPYSSNRTSKISLSKTSHTRIPSRLKEPSIFSASKQLATESTNSKQYSFNQTTSARKNKRYDNSDYVSDDDMNEESKVNQAEQSFEIKCHKSLYAVDKDYQSEQKSMNISLFDISNIEILNSRKSRYNQQSESHSKQAWEDVLVTSLEKISDL